MGDCGNCFGLARGRPRRTAGDFHVQVHLEGMDQLVNARYQGGRDHFKLADDVDCDVVDI